MEPNPCIFELPDDAILHVMSFLEPQHVVGSMTASRELANVIESGSTAIWKPLVRTLTWLVKMYTVGNNKVWLFIFVIFRFCGASVHTLVPSSSA
jgi:hypothetical protein